MYGGCVLSDHGLLIRLNTSVISRHRVEKSLRTDNNSFIVLKHPNHNNRQSVIREYLPCFQLHRLGEIREMRWNCALS